MAVVHLLAISKLATKVVNRLANRAQLSTRIDCLTFSRTKTAKVYPKVTCQVQQSLTQFKIFRGLTLKKQIIRSTWRRARYRELCLCRPQATMTANTGGKSRLVLFKSSRQRTIRIQLSPPRFSNHSSSKTT